jgi:streptogramin lyase
VRATAATVVFATAFTAFAVTLVLAAPAVFAGTPTSGTALGSAADSTSAALFARARAQTARDVVVDGKGIYPESMSSLPNGTLYVGSLGGTLYRALPGHSRAEPWIRRSAANSLLSIFGVLADPRTHSLWVCSSPAKLPGGVADGVASVMRFDLSTGARTGHWPLPTPQALCDDITFAPDGTAFVADLANGEILTLAPHGRALELFARDPLLKGMDGIAFAADGTLYADNITRSLLLRVDRSPSGRFAGLTTLETSQPISGPDGLRLIGGNRFALAEGRAGRIDEVTIRGDRATIRVLRTGLMSPASVTPVGDTVYAADGKVQYLFSPALRGKDPGPFVVHAIPIR